MMHSIYFILNLIKIIFVCKRYYANAGVKLQKNMDFQRFMGFMMRKKHEI